MTNKGVPFGVLFQEPAADLGQVEIPIYDENREISLVQRDGEAVPFVTAAPAAMATQTLTEAAGESTDKDFDPRSLAWSLSTFTTTKMERDPTDRDRSLSLAVVMATQTGVAVTREDTDQH